MTRLRVLLAVLPLTAVLAACSSGSDSGGDGGGGDSASSGEAGSFAEGDAAQDVPQESTGKDGAAASKGGRNSSSETRLDRAVISHGTVSLVADDVAAARREVQRVVDATRGEVSEENTESDRDGDTVYARLVLRVPAAEFDDAMTALEGVAELRSSQRTAEDVTTQVIDTEARLRAQQASLERVEALLARAEQLQQIVWIESQLTQRQAELDSLRQQQAWLADQTSLSTVTVDIERTPAEKKEKQEAGGTGFLSGLSGGMRALGAATSALATITGALLPFVALVALLALPVWLVRRVVRRRRPAAGA